MVSNPSQAVIHLDLRLIRLGYLVNKSNVDEAAPRKASSRSSANEATAPLGGGAHRATSRSSDLGIRDMRRLRPLHDSGDLPTRLLLLLQPVLA